MNYVFGLQTIQIPGHDFIAKTALPCIMSPLFTFIASNNVSLATDIGKRSGGRSARPVPAALGEGASQDHTGTGSFILLIGNKYLKNTFDPLAARISSSQLGSVFSDRHDFTNQGSGATKTLQVIQSGTNTSGADITKIYTVPGYNSNNYFQRSAHIGGRYVFGGTRTRSNLIAATHGNDARYFTQARAKFFSFDSYSRYSVGGNALQNDGFFLRLTPVGGASILRFVVLTTPTRLRIITSQGETDIPDFGLQTASMAQFTEQEAVSSNPIVNTYTANYQVTLDAFVVNLIQGSEELKRDRYVPVSCLLYTSPSPRD